MMLAEEARKITNDARENGVKNVLRKIMIKIEMSANNGYESIEFINLRYMDEVEKELKNHGYNVNISTSFDGDTIFEISW